MTHAALFGATGLKALELLGYEIGICNDGCSGNDGLFLMPPHFRHADDASAVLDRYRDKCSIADDRTAAEWLASPQFALNSRRTPMQKAALYTAGVVFATVAVAHGVRLTKG